MDTSNWDSLAIVEMEKKWVGKDPERGWWDLRWGDWICRNGMWGSRVHGVARSWTRLSDFPFTFHFRALEKEMATHSSVLAWRIPGTGDPGGLPSMGSHRVGHNWSDLAAAAAELPVQTARYCQSQAAGTPVGACQYRPSVVIRRIPPIACAERLLGCFHIMALVRVFHEKLPAHGI